MSIIVDISVPADEFALGHLLEVRSGVRIRLESMIPTGGTMIPYFWVESPDAGAVEAALRESGLVESVVTVDEVGGETLFRVDWSEDVDGLIESIGAADAVVLSGEGHGDHWSFQLRFADTEEVSTFYRDLIDKGVSIELDRLRDSTDATEPPAFDLSPAQREALLTALEAGYFAVPRETTLVELAERLGISDSAVSQRIRRGLTAILQATLAQRSADRNR